MVDNKPSDMSSQPIRADNAGNRQSAETGQDTGKAATSGVHSNFASAAAESNVNPPGAPQSSHGSVAGAVAAGKDGAASPAQQKDADVTTATAGETPGGSALEAHIQSGKPSM